MARSTLPPSVQRARDFAAALEAQELERDPEKKKAELVDKITSMNKGVQDDGKSKYGEKNRLFKRDIDAGKLYT